MAHSGDRQGVNDGQDGGYAGRSQQRRHVSGYRRTSLPRAPHAQPPEEPLEELPPDPVSQAMRHVLRANAHMDAGETQTAVQTFAKAVDAKSDHAPAYYGRACAYRKLGELEKSLSNFTCAIQYKSDYGIAFTARASLYLEMEEYELAVEDASEAIRISPDDLAAYKARAAAYNALGEMDRCFDDYETVSGLEAKRLCVICMENTRASRLHPCMHAAMCLECASDLANKRLPCPICSGEIVSVESGSFETTWSPDELANLNRSSASAHNASNRSTPTRPNNSRGSSGSPDSPLHLPPTPPLESRLPGPAYLERVVEDIEDELVDIDPSPPTPNLIAADPPTSSIISTAVIAA